NTGVKTKLTVLIIEVTNATLREYGSLKNCANTQNAGAIINSKIHIIIQRPELEFIICALLVADRKSTRLNSSHVSISYAVFCLKKKNKRTPNNTILMQQK